MRAGSLRLTAVAGVLTGLWWLVLVGGSLAVLGFASAAAAQVSLRISVPVFVSLPAVSGQIDAARRPSSLSGLSGQLRTGASTVVVLAVLVVVVIAAGLLLVVLSQLRALVAGLRAGRPFGANAARRVTVVGAVMIVGELLRAGVICASSWWAARHRSVAGVRLHVGLPLRVEVLAAGVLLVIFAEVFRLGALMQDEQDLTI